MGKKTDLHVTPRKDGKWNVRRAGADRASSVHDTQKGAIKQGRTQARSNQSELRIHGKDGKIRDSDSYGNDPNPPKDRKH